MHSRVCAVLFVGSVAAFSPAALPLLRSRSPRHAVAVMSEAPGVKTMPSGLVFEEITAGTGESPGLEQTVKVRLCPCLRATLGQRARSASRLRRHRA